MKCDDDNNGKKICASCMCICNRESFNNQKLVSRKKNPFFFFFFFVFILNCSSFDFWGISVQKSKSIKLDFQQQQQQQKSKFLYCINTHTHTHNWIYWPKLSFSSIFFLNCFFLLCRKNDQWWTKVKIWKKIRMFE